IPDLCLLPGFLPKPSLSAWPSSVVPARSNVTLQCMSPTPGVYLVLRKGAIVLGPRLPNHLTEGTSEFHLTELQPSNAGYYTCEYYVKEFPETVSQPSNVLLLLITGALSKPSLQSHQQGKVASRRKVTLQCQMPVNRTEYKTLALLKEGASLPTQLQSSENDSVEFILPNVTVSDTGSYSCVYHQATAPFWASHPSDHLDILVTGIHLKNSPQLTYFVSPNTTSVFTKRNLIRLGMASVIMLIMGAFLVEAWHSQRESPGEPR
uniref:Ig-like domain-containing protein n=1 Tax=Castor canadensis TaxID=51338 RepID=A0A8C0W2Y6_CASCN